MSTFLAALDFTFGNGIVNVILLLIFGALALYCMPNGRSAPELSSNHRDTSNNSSAFGLASSADDADGDFVVVDLLAPANLHVATYNFKTGGVTAANSLQPGRKNRHGAKRFVVKVQLPLGGQELKTGNRPYQALIYDETRNVQTKTDSEALSNAVAKFAVAARGPKAFFWASREGDEIRIYIDKAAPSF